MTRPTAFSSLMVVGLVLCGAAARADVTLPALLSTHAVLQKSDHTAIWGTAVAGEKVSVSLGGVRAGTSAGNDGKWRVSLDLRNVGEGPFDLVVEGTNRRVVSDVMVGEVWVCAGQSNMAFGLVRAGEAEQEIPQSANPRLRQFRVSNQASETPAEDCKGAWIVAHPDTAKEFSAVGYFFGKKLQQETRQPIGLVLSAWAGTSAACWLPQAAFDADPELKSRQASVKKRVDDYPALKEQYLPAYRQWEVEFGRADHPADPPLYAAADLKLDGWKTVTLPSALKAAGLPDSGAVWFRKRITLPPGSLEDAMIQLGAVRDFNTLYINGNKIGETTVESLKGGFDVRYALPKGALREGVNTIAIRLFTPSEKAALPSTLFLGIGAARILLNGEWTTSVEFELPALTDEARKALPTVPPNPGTHSVPGRIFNGMVHPLMAATIRGVVWYQGEQDTGQPGGYWKMFEAVIRGWRAGWDEEFPFYFCQLPNNGAKTEKPDNSLWAQLREAQAKALTLPKTGQAVLIDVGEEDVHPIYKREVGERLARLALARTYGQSVVDSGPAYKSMVIEAGRVRISFDSTDGGLVAKPLPAQYQPTSMSPALKPLVRHSPDGDLEGFAICGEDRRWVWATATIDGDAVLVGSPAVPKPVAVRYAWASNPTCNLYNGAGLPAAPFQTEGNAMTPPQAKTLPMPGEQFSVAGCAAFLILPERPAAGKGTPWVWYAPTLPAYPGAEEKWMIERFTAAGIAVAGIDVGESYGSPAGRASFTSFYDEMVTKRGFSQTPCLLARSRGGLMLYNWAVEHPSSVACVAGIYPVCNLSSYPGLKNACGAYGLTEEQLAAMLTAHNPIDRLEPLAKAGVPLYHLHGDNDTVVPLEKNSGELAQRYRQLGGTVTLNVIAGQGHNRWSGWFQDQGLVDFVILRARGPRATAASVGP